MKKKTITLIAILCSMVFIFNTAEAATLTQTNNFESKIKNEIIENHKKNSKNLTDSNYGEKIELVNAELYTSIFAEHPYRYIDLHFIGMKALRIKKLLFLTHFIDEFLIKNGGAWPLAGVPLLKDNFFMTLKYKVDNSPDEKPYVFYSTTVKGEDSQTGESKEITIEEPHKITFIHTKQPIDYSGVTGDTELEYIFKLLLHRFFYKRMVDGFFIFKYEGYEEEGWPPAAGFSFSNCEKIIIEYL